MSIRSTSLSLFAIVVPGGLGAVISLVTRKIRQVRREPYAAFSRLRMERASKDAASFCLTAQSARLLDQAGANGVAGA